MKQYVFIPYDKSYKVIYEVSDFSSTQEELFINSINSEVNGSVVPGLYSAAISIGMPDKVRSITKTEIDALATACNMTLKVYEDRKAVVDIHSSQSTESKILTFAVPSQSGSTTIDHTAKTIGFSMPHGTTVTALVPTFTLSTSATANKTSGNAINFTSPVTIRVTAEHGEVSDYVVTCTVL